MGRMVRYSCECGYTSGELLLGEGDGPVFRWVMAAPHYCSRCGVLLDRFTFRPGVKPEEVEEAVTRGGGSFRPLTDRALLAMAGEIRAGVRTCPYCREPGLSCHRDSPPPCPHCGRETREEQCGSWS